MGNIKPMTAIITFTDDRDVGLYSKEVEDHLRKKQLEIKNFLISNDVVVIDPLNEIKKKSSMPYGIRNLHDVAQVLAYLSNHIIEGVIIGAWNWSPPMLIMDFVRKLAKPIMYYSENDPLTGSLSQ